jgi:hypothetical protein
VTDDSALNISMQLSSLSEHSTKMDDTNLKTVVSILERIASTQVNNTDVCVNINSEV